MTVDVQGAAAMNGVTPTSRRLEVALIAESGTVAAGLEALYVEMAKFRANVYVTAGFLTPDELDSRGTDLTADDHRSAHFVIVSRGVHESESAVLANMRCIHKGAGGDPLPVERLCPESFDAPLSDEAVEVSRLISRPGGGPAFQSSLKWPLFLAALEWVENRGVSEAVALISPNLAGSFQRQGIPLQPCGDARYIPEINAFKLPAIIDMARLRTHFAGLGMSAFGLSLGEFRTLDAPNSELPVLNAATRVVT